MVKRLSFAPVFYRFVSKKRNCGGVRGFWISKKCGASVSDNSWFSLMRERIRLVSDQRRHIKMAHSFFGRACIRFVSASVRTSLNTDSETKNVAVFDLCALDAPTCTG